MSEITLYKRLYDEMEFESNHGSARYKFEAITAIQRGRQILPLLHFQEMMDGVASYSIAPETIRMPHAVGKRVMEFCQAAYVEGEGGFNCHSFVRAAMGWRENIYHHSYSCPTKAVGLNEVCANQPYTIPPPAIGDSMLHSFLGMERPGYALNVAGPDLPLTINWIPDLLKCYGRQTILRLSD